MPLGVCENTFTVADAPAASHATPRTPSWPARSARGRTATHLQEREQPAGDGSAEAAEGADAKQDDAERPQDPNRLLDEDTTDAAASRSAPLPSESDDTMSYDDADVRALEDLYWEFVETNNGAVEVEYGNDLDIKKFGTGFVPEAKHPWDFNKLPSKSMLKLLFRDFPGLNTPWLYLGMMFATFCWHVEDHALFSVNVHHAGAPKTWYGIPSTKARDFERALLEHAPEAFKENPDLIHQLVALLSPSQCKLADVPVYRLVQRPGEFVVTFPDAYHTGFSHGFNIAEAVNFALPGWLPAGREAVARYGDEKSRRTQRKAIFSHDRMLWAACCEAAIEVGGNPTRIVGDPEGLARVKLLRDELKVAIKQEMHYRWWCQEGAEEGYIQSVRQVEPPGRSEDDENCVLCQGCPYFSVVRCACSSTAPNGSASSSSSNGRPSMVCPRHFARLNSCFSWFPPKFVSADLYSSLFVFFF